jgi:two-component system response regulator PilR (NtrC family)
MPSVLLVDDEPDIVEILEMVLREEEMEVYTSRSGREALAVLRDRKVDVVVSDIRMPDLTGVELLRQAKRVSPETTFVMMTAFASTETAIEALQHGAFDYLTKPFKMEELKSIVLQALRRRDLKPAIPTSHAELEARQSKRLFQALARTQIVGKSEKMLEVYRTIGTVAAGESTVLITGESGTGKELVARAIHEASLRKDGAFLSINCSAFPETLLESELFGYMKGAFTGAGTNRKGLFEVAGGGSVFLDEIGEMTPAMQVKLLRVLQERKLRPLGGSAEVSIDVRVIAATNKDLQS